MLNIDNSLTWNVGRHFFRTRRYKGSKIVVSNKNVLSTNFNSMKPPKRQVPKTDYLTRSLTKKLNEL